MKLNAKPISALGHNMGEWTTTKEPTYTEKGIKERKCTRTGCNYKETEEIAVKVHTHTYGDWVTTTEPTCKDKGVATRTCSVCGAKDTKELDTTAHKAGEFGKILKVNGVKYTENGHYVHGKKCVYCDQVLESSPCNTSGRNYEAIDGVNYHSETSWQIDPNKIHWANCSVCGGSTAVNHTYQPAYSQTPRGVNGYHDKWMKCTKCGRVQDNSRVYEKCNYVKGNTVAETCTTDGYTVYTCACGQTKKDKIPKLNHPSTHSGYGSADPGYHIYKTICNVCGGTVSSTRVACNYYIKGNTVPATCTSGGYTVYKCACGATKDKDSTSARGHNYTIAQNSYTNTGSSHLRGYKCSRCSSTTTKSESHSYGTYVSTKNATCTEKGYQIYKCGCGATTNKNYTKELGHNYTKTHNCRGINTKLCSRCRKCRYCGSKH